MKHIHSFLLVGLLIISSSLLAQTSLDSLLSRVDEANPSLISARSLLDVQILDAKTGLTPYNPEVEFGYMWGQPDELGNRLDFAVSQSFDFPTVYSSKSRLSKINQNQAELQYNATRQELMLKARQAWVERVYLNVRKSMLNDRLAYAKIVLAGYERKLETGESNQLQLNQARMKVIAAENEINRLQQKLNKNIAEIKNMTGNSELIIQDTVYPPSKPIVLDTLLIRYRDGYVSMMYQSEIDKKEKEVDVIFNQKLPKLKAGYYSESILGTNLRGVQAGITIPLWENARAVKTAKANLAYAETDSDRYWQQQENYLKLNYEQWIYLKDRIIELEELLAISNNEFLLRKAMEAGELSLTEYFYESDFYFQNLLNLLDFKRDVLMIETELRKVYY